jgi:hypothetical protein
MNFADKLFKIRLQLSVDNMRDTLKPYFLPSTERPVSENSVFIQYCVDWLIYLLWKNSGDLVGVMDLVGVGFCWCDKDCKMYSYLAK